MCWRGVISLAQSTRRGAHVDWRGLLLIASFSTATLIGVSRFSRWTAMALAGAAILAGTYWRYARRAPEPVLLLRYVTGRPFAVINLVGLAAIAAVLPVVVHFRYSSGAASTGALPWSRSV